MKSIYSLTIAGLAVAAVVGLGGLTAMAHQGEGDGNAARGMAGGGGYRMSLESRANVLGMTTEELETALESKTMSQIAVEKGMDQDTFHAKMTEAAKTRWEQMDLDPEEIQDRLKQMESRHEENTGDHEFGSGEGMHRGGHGRHQ